MRSTPTVPASQVTLTRTGHEEIIERLPAPLPPARSGAPRPLFFNRIRWARSVLRDWHAERHQR